MTDTHKVSCFEISPTYKKFAGDLWSLDLNQLPLPKNFKIKERSIVYLAPKIIAGNHHHPRTEIFLGLGSSLKLIWQDETGKIHRNPMNPENKLYLFKIPANLAHAIINESNHQTAILLELADAKQDSVNKDQLI